MKWSIAGLFGLGFLSAACAAILVATLQAGETQPVNEGPVEPATAEIAVAADDFDVMSILDEDSITIRTVNLDAAPADGFSDPIQLIGKMLASPMKKGQPFSRDNLVAEGSAAHLAASLPEGSRIVSIVLTDSMGVENLLEPGSLVDVLASMRRTSAGGKSHPVAITLLRGVRVVAIGNRTLVSPAQKNPQASSVRMSGGRPSVSLLVDSQQAEKLKLAAQEGSLTLALRNPLDASGSSDEAEGGVTGLDTLSPAFSSSGETVEAPSSYWETVIVRGGVAESKKFDL